MIVQGAKIDAEDNDSNTSLILAARENHTKVADVLIAGGEQDLNCFLYMEHPDFL